MRTCVFGRRLVDCNGKPLAMDMASTLLVTQKMSAASLVWSVYPWRGIRSARLICYNLTETET